jgi:hypothetical protein
MVLNRLISLGKKPLVVLPNVYGKPGNFIPNSISGGLTTIAITDYDRSFLKRLLEKDMLKNVPNNYDDLYCILASLNRYHSKEIPIYVVTNDLMRDHRFHFPEESVFHRWKTSQIIYFIPSQAFSRTVHKDYYNIAENIDASTHYNTTDNSTNPQTGKNSTNHQGKTPTAHLFFPGLAFSCSFSSFTYISTLLSLFT